MKRRSLVGRANSEETDCQLPIVNHSVARRVFISRMIVNDLQPWQRRFPLVGAVMFAAVAMLLASCAATSTFTAENAPEYMVVKAYSPFYKIGPMQARPDASLPVDTRFKLLRQEMGFSYVLLDDGRQGYVANENMAPAPPRPAPTPSDDGSVDGKPGKKRGNRPNSPRYSGEQLNDIPLPDVNIPAPDLNIGSEDISAPAPTPTPPVEKPQFRY